MDTVLNDPWLLWYMITENPDPELVRNFIIIFKKIRAYIQKHQLQNKLYTLLSKPVKIEIFSQIIETYFILPNGYKHGLYQSWFSGNRKREQVNYILNKREGLYQKWDVFGNLWECINYINNKREGCHTTWSSIGYLEMRTEFKNDLLDGLYQCWYPNGQLGAQMRYVCGQRDGPSLEWYDNGQLKVSGYYSKNWQVKTWRYWDVLGQLVRKEKFIYPPRNN